MTDATITTHDLLLHDVSDMLGAVDTIPTQLPDGWTRAHAHAHAVRDRRPARPRSLVVCGMGGSGVGADLLQVVADPAAPIVAVKGYELPAWVDEQDAVICVSYSGTTAETLSCFEQAHKKATLVAVITTGGELARSAHDHSIPVVELPAGMQPRAAVGVIFGALVGVADSVGIIEHGKRIIEDAQRGSQTVVELHVGATDEDGTSTEGLDDDPPALTIARQIAGTIPVVYGVGDSVPVAHRWKAQLNENGKMPAFANAYPELDHNELVGWELAANTGAQWSLVEIVPGGVLPSLRTRMDVTRELIADGLAATIRIDATSMSRAGAVFELVTWGDYVSVYSALLAGVDPTPVARIQELKQRLDGR